VSNIIGSVVVNLVDTLQVALVAFTTFESLATVDTIERFYDRVDNAVTIQLPFVRERCCTSITPVSMLHGQQPTIIKHLQDLI
jgi:hypothetical protein